MPAGSSSFVTSLRTPPALGTTGVGAIVPAARFGNPREGTLIHRCRHSQIFRAIDSETGRPVAIKLETQSPVSLPRRLCEAAVAPLLDQLRSRHLRRVVGWGILADGGSFLALEYLEGESLDQLLGLHGSLSPRDAVVLFIQFASGLQSLHDSQVLHRDVTPEHLFVASGSRGVLIDFGISRSPSIMAQGLTRLLPTRPGMPWVMELCGHAEYVPPSPTCELGGTEPRDDLFMLGASFYEALTGRKAFPWAVRRDHTRRILDDGRMVGPSPWILPPKLSEFVEAPTEKHDRALRALDKIVFKAVAYRRWRRFQSASDLISALDKWKVSFGDLPWNRPLLPGVPPRRLTD